jgi:hypothetical protein
LDHLKMFDDLIGVSKCKKLRPFLLFKKIIKYIPFLMTSNPLWDHVRSSFVIISRKRKRGSKVAQTEWCQAKEGRLWKVNEESSKMSFTNKDCQIWRCTAHEEHFKETSNLSANLSIQEIIRNFENISILKRWSNF